jgi:hypothetical protein
MKDDGQPQLAQQVEDLLRTGALPRPWCGWLFRQERNQCLACKAMPRMTRKKMLKHVPSVQKAHLSCKADNCRLPQTILQEYYDPEHVLRIMFQEAGQLEKNIEFINTAAALADSGQRRKKKKDSWDRVTMLMRKITETWTRRTTGVRYHRFLARAHLFYDGISEAFKDSWKFSTAMTTKHYWTIAIAESMGCCVLGAMK